MKVRVHGIRGLCDAWLERDEAGLVKMIFRHPNGETVGVEPEVCLQRVYVEWGTQDEIETMLRLKFIK